MTDNKGVIKLLKQGNHDVSKIKRKLFVCGCCGGGSQAARILGIFEDWGVGVECINPECKKHWFLCSKCPSRQKMTHKRQVYDHWRYKHKVSGTIDKSLSDLDTKNVPISLAMEEEESVETTEPTRGMESQIDPGNDMDMSQDSKMEYTDITTNFEMGENENNQSDDVFDIENIDWEDNNQKNGFGFNSESNNEEYFHHLNNNDGDKEGLQFLVK